MNDKQFQENRFRVLNTIEEMLDEPLTPEVVELCHWRRVYDNKGTTFQSRTAEDLPCVLCKGYDTNCNNYMNYEGN